ncbi:hypothetical protein DFS34DRAFT_660820 [Phlyctochytrium arcticum]|nr:hypothetical protein DFS34DRAFT_660820 [Phlyctochytrium arcticum]
MPQLPTEIIAQIVEHYLDDDDDNYDDHGDPRDIHQKLSIEVLCLVSRAWKDIAERHLWVEPVVLVRAKHFKAVYNALSVNPQLGRFIRILYVDVIKYDSSKLVRIVARHCPNLKKLDLYCCPLSNQDFYELAENCEKLARLTLEHCPNITAEGWIRAAPFLKQLRILWLTNLRGFEDKAVRAIVDSCPLLETVVLRNTDLTCDGVLYVMLNAPALVDLSIQDNERIERRGTIDAISTAGHDDKSQMLA